jgi:DNA-binding transcriptional MerR regulator
MDSYKQGHYDKGTSRFGYAMNVQDDMAAESAQHSIGTGVGSLPDIPDKLYFRIGEVARLAGIKPYVLRFWETEFPALGPKKSGTGHRLFRRKDVELVLEIKRLLYEKRFTIEGARKFLDGRGKSEPVRVAQKAKRAKKAQTSLFPADPGPALDAVRTELRAIAELLK